MNVIKRTQSSKTINRTMKPVFLLTFYAVFFSFFTIADFAATQSRSVPPNLSVLPSPSYPWIVLKNGKIESGMILQLSETELLFKKNTQETQTLKRSEISSIVFVPPIDPITVRRFFARHLRSDSNSKDRQTILLTNGDRFSGRILKYSERKLSTLLPGFDEPVTIPMRRLRAVVF